MRQQGDTTFIDVLNALRIGEMRTEHFAILNEKINKESTGEFAIEKALRIYPTLQQVNDHNLAVLDIFKAKGTQMYKIKAQDKLVDATQNLGNINLKDKIAFDINKTGGLPQQLKIFIDAKVMLRSNINVAKGLVNGSIGYFTDITCPLSRREQVYDQDIPSVKIDLGSVGVHVVQPISIQFPAKYYYGTAERRMLPPILSWALTVHKMQGCTVDYAIIYLGSKLFEEGQAYVALSRVKSMDGLRIEDLDCTKLTGKTPCNITVLEEMERNEKHLIKKSIKNQPTRCTKQVMAWDHQWLQVAFSDERKLHLDAPDDWKYNGYDLESENSFSSKLQYGGRKSEQNQTRNYGCLQYPTVINVLHAARRFSGILPLEFPPVKIGCVHRDLTGISPKTRRGNGFRTSDPPKPQQRFCHWVIAILNHVLKKSDKFRQ
ncbi:ATP-dependent DNA helicase PIF1 [Araneus ventricosus]|uniref:ATP-dependent DNA helicase PIF1 n=1 Tax=Araneus ventricosus TaxID=182803 RepID=A0A4Y2AH67_ARAVE|nr:ATP-dependent DNA helicase PIF1 [Araneus ventricosus]